MKKRIFAIANLAGSTCAGITNNNTDRQLEAFPEPAACVGIFRNNLTTASGCFAAPIGVKGAFMLKL